MTDALPLPALHAAAATGDRKAVRQRLDAGDPIETRDANGRTVLHIAAAIRSLSMIDILLERAADAKAIDSDGRTALHHLVRGPRAAGIPEPSIPTGHRFVVDSAASLLEAGTPVNLVDSRGRTALHEAALNASEATGVLVSHGADVKIADKQGWTAIHFAAAAASVGTVSVLLSGRADVNAKNRWGWAPLDLCRIDERNFARYQDVELVLKQAHAKPSGGPSFELMRQLLRGDRRAALEALAKGADPDVEDAYGTTARDLAAKSPFPDLREALAKKPPAP